MAFQTCVMRWFSAVSSACIAMVLLTNAGLAADEHDATKIDLTMPSWPPTQSDAYHRQINWINVNALEASTAALYGRPGDFGKPI